MLEEVMRLRRDVRENNFTQQDITAEVVEKILMAASLAPSVGFSQPWEFVVIREHELEKLNWEKRKSIKSVVYRDRYPSEGQTLK